MPKLVRAMPSLFHQQYTVYANRSPSRSWSSLFCLAILWAAAAGMTLWALGALWYDPREKTLGHIVAGVYIVGALVLVGSRKTQWRKLTWLAIWFALVLSWWLTLQPSNERPWQPDVAQTAWAEIRGDTVTLHNVRNCEYRTELDYTPRWETRTVDLSHLSGVDLAINYWGSAWMAHPIASFQFSDGPPVCFSIETRKEIGESYSAIGGLYRQYELIYICADERDALRVRTNYRQGEDVYLYHTTMAPPAVRARFMEYIAAMNDLHTRPRWYNAASTNCTTSIRSQRDASQRAPWDWRILFNGYGDEMLYQRGALATGGLPFAELKRRARINDAARAANDDPDFSVHIRAGRPGFEGRVAAAPQ
jgi:hypothetical protein